MSNFSFLHENTQYALFASAAIEAEKVYTSAPAMCAVGCRKALELAGMAIDDGKTIEDWKRYVFPHPTVGEIFREL